MEVHHHAHHGHEKKTWKSYFWEFFMLFLAVLCGSLAELQIEHYIEHKREQEFIKSLSEDLKSDLKVVERGLIYNNTMINGKDSLVLLINRGISTDAQVDTFYRLHKRYVGISRQFPFSKATISQLLNAGNLRLIKKKNVADSITNYQSKIDYFEKQLLPQFVYYDEKTIDASEKLIDTKYFLASSKTGKYLPSSNAKLASSDLALLKAFSFRLEIDKEGNQNTKANLKSIGKHAEYLLSLLESEYDLK